MPDIFCIAAGQLSPKKEDTRINRKNRYLNFGLLSVATRVKRAGLDPIQLQGDFTDPSTFLELCLEWGIEETKYPILFSVPTFYALDWAAQFLTLLKAAIPECTVYVGGRWVIDGSPDLLKTHLPQADRIINGLGESQVLDILGLSAEEPLAKIPKLDFSILANRCDYQPSIEVARGCGMGCSFCQEGGIDLSQMKPVPDLVEELNQTLRHNDGLRPMTPYFQASMFRPRKQWLEELVAHRAQLPDNLQWRAQSRVDMLSASQIGLLAEAGLKVLDPGLESASPRQLKAMDKSSKPEVYLRKASKLIEAAAEHDIYVKLNLLLYAGENDETISETHSWLTEHHSLFKGISIGPVLAFGWPDRSADFVAQLQNQGASVNNKASQTGITKFDLSPSVSHDYAQLIAKNLSREFMAAEDYFYLKAFSYFPRSYRYREFLDDLQESEQGPFGLLL